MRRLAKAGAPGVLGSFVASGRAGLARSIMAREYASIDRQERI